MPVVTHKKERCDFRTAPNNKHATPRSTRHLVDLGILAAGAAEMHELAHPKGYKVPNEQKHMLEIAAVARVAYAEHKKRHPNDHNKQHLKDLGALAAAIVEMKPRGK